MRSVQTCQKDTDIEAGCSSSRGSGGVLQHSADVRTAALYCQQRTTFREADLASHLHTMQVYHCTRLLYTAGRMMALALAILTRSLLVHSCRAVFAAEARARNDPKPVSTHNG